MVKRALGKRNFPGRLTLEEWLTVLYRERIDLIWRAQCDLLGSFRFCAANPCDAREHAAAMILNRAGDSFGTSRRRCQRQYATNGLGLIVSRICDGERGSVGKKISYHLFPLRRER
jgi:hypothetical protein